PPSRYCTLCLEVATRTSMLWSSSRASSRAVSRARALPHHVELHACRLFCLRIATLTGRCPFWRHVLPVGTIAQINFGLVVAWSPSTAVFAWCVRFRCCFAVLHVQPMISAVFRFG